MTHNIWTNPADPRTSPFAKLVVAKNIVMIARRIASQIERETEKLTRPYRTPVTRVTFD